MRRALPTLVVLAAAAVSLAAALPAGGASKPRCTISGKFTQRGTLLTYRLRCNFRVDTLGLRSSRPVRRVGAARLDRADDRLRCRRRSSSLMRCAGDVSSDSRIRQAIRVRRRPCEAAKFRLRTAGPEVRDFVAVLRRAAGC